MRFITFFSLALLLLTCSLFAHCQAISKIKVEGVSGELKQNIALYLADSKGQTVNAALLNANKELVQNAVKVFGYYSPEVTFNVKTKEDETTLVVDVKKGKATRIHSLNIMLTGEGLNDEKVAAQLNNLALKQGQILRHSEYEAAKSTLNSLLLERGYFDAKWKTHQLRVNRAQYRAEIELLVDSGVRYRYGELVIANETPSAQLIQSMSPLAQGAYYQAHQVSEFNLALANTPYYRSVRVYGDLAARKAGVVPVKVEVVHKPNNSFEVGGGFSTDQREKIRFKWSKPWLTEYGHYLETNLEATHIEQQLRFSYTIPVDNPNDDVWRLGVGYLNDENKISEKFTTQVQRQWLTPDKWVRTAFFKHERENYQVGDENFSADMFLPGISYARKKTKGGTTPYWGTQWLFSTEVSSEALGSTTELLKAQFQTQWLRTLNQNHLFYTRLNLGGIWTDDIDNVPVSMRFFAGGDKSIRGFKYESVSPTVEGEAVGAKYLATGTLEYNYQFKPKWRGALFVDGGTATNDFSESLSVGVGLGIRYITPIGPIRVDYAWAISEPGTPARISITLGPEI